MTMLFVADIAQLKAQRARLLAMGERARTQSLRRVHSFVGPEITLRTKRRMDAGVDVDGNPMKSKRADRRGTPPLGGSHKAYGRSLKWSLDSNGDLKHFSTHPGADVVYSGKDIVPVNGKFLTLPVEAPGGFANDSSSSADELSLVGNRSGLRARHYKNTFFRWLSGRLWLLQKDDTSKRLRFLFLLVKRTRREANRWMGFSTKPVLARNSDVDMIRDAYARWVTEAA